MKNCDIFPIFAHNIDSGNTLEQRGKNKKIMYTPINLNFTI